MNKKNKITVIGLSGESVFLKVDHFNHEGETIVANTLCVEYGGKGYNQAVACARCGVEVTFMTCFGNDDVRLKALNDLNKEGIQTIEVVKEGTSAKAVIIIDKQGRNNVIVYPGVSKMMTEDDLSLVEDDIKESKYLLLQLELSDEVLSKAIQIANKYNTLVILNPAPYHNIDENLIKKCYLLTPNEIEAKQMFNINKVEEIPSNLQQNLIITLGDKGCMSLFNNKLTLHQGRVAKVLNTTGAGDTFNGVLASMLCLDKTIDEAISKSIIASSMSVEKEFVIDSIPYYNKDSDEFYFK